MLVEVKASVHPDLYHDLSRVPKSYRAERIRLLATVGLIKIRSGLCLEGLKTVENNHDQIEVNLLIKEAAHKDLYAELSGSGTSALPPQVRLLATLGLLEGVRQQYQVVGIGEGLVSDEIKSTDQSKSPPEKTDFRHFEF